jgi:sporulation integral membrane protein YtvI
MFNGIGDREKRKIIIVFLYVGVSIVVYLFMRYMLYLAAPFLSALFIAWALDRPVTWLWEKIHLPRAAGGLLVLLVIFVLAGAGLLYVGCLAIRQLSAFMGNYGLYAEKINEEACILCEHIDDGLGLRTGSSYSFLNGNVGNALTNGMDKMVSFLLGCSVNITKKAAVWIAGVFISITAAVFLIHDFDKIRRSYSEGALSGGLNVCFGKMFRFGVVYLRTQLIIMSITMLVCTVGLLFMKNPYALLVGILIGLLDALPVFGTGTVLIPWTIIDLLFGNFIHAAVIFSTYLICYCVREILEPKLMGSNMGIHPVIMLMTMYAGVILFGICGFVLGPAAYIVVAEIMEYVKAVL